MTGSPDKSRPTHAELTSLTERLDICRATNKVLRGKVKEEQAKYDTTQRYLDKARARYDEVVTELRARNAAAAEPVNVHAEVLKLRAQVAALELRLHQETQANIRLYQLHGEWPPPGDDTMPARERR